ncbi:MAG: tetratricopeptide repeat protein, partial [Geminicoccales bacterium]
PLLSGIIYWRLGSPDQPAAPFAGRAAERQRAAEAGGPGDARAPSIQSLIPPLEAHLEAHPDDLEGWLRLGQSYALTQDFERAATAYRRALAIDPKVAQAHSALGEALVMAGGGIVTEPAKQAFSRALELEPSDPRARFYTGLALAQQGARRQALDAWTALIRDSPADAPWLAALRQRATALAQDLGLDPAKVLPRAVAKAEPAEPPASPALPSDPERLRQAALRLEKQLAADPKDFESWIRLARSWQALGDSARAKQALEGGLDAYPGAPFVRQQLQSAAADLGIDLASAGSGSGPSAEQMQAARSMSPEERTTMIRGMVAGLAERLDKQPDDAEGWRMLGRSYQV